MEKATVKDSVLPSVPRSVSMKDAEAYHQHLIDQINQQQLSASANPDTPKLMPYNGYYTLGNATGAFFAVDTNMVFLHPKLPEPNFDLKLTIFDLTLIISLDGKRATRHAFTGTFDGTTLIQEASGLSINLVFTRTVGSYGPVASCSGSITLPGQAAVSVTGTTYNNPIPASLFAGDYYVVPPGSTCPLQVMSIGSDNQVYYDNGKNNGRLSPVTVYLYNLNMYYFTFVQGNDTVRLIMGTAGEQGFACNNMTTGTGNCLVTRSLLTIPEAKKPALELYDLSSCQLADFSGYYQIQNATSPLAFVSIQAQYVTLLPNTNLDLYFVIISVSLDGVHSKSYYFNPFTMSFDGETLNMPEQGILLKLTREYGSQNGSLVSMSGMIGNQTISAFTLFNPVPLSVFGGIPLTNSAGDKLTVNDDNSVTYNGTDMNSIIYVPLMYILAYPADDPNVVMSFGTDGPRGNACIVTVDANTDTPKTTSVWAIPSAV